MTEDEDNSPTPTTLPGKPKPARGRLSAVERRYGVPKATATETNTNGIPMEVDFEDTGEIDTRLYGAAKEASPVDPEHFIEALAHKLLAHGGGGDGGSGVAKTAKKQNTVAILLMLILGPGGALAVVYATRDQANSNSHDVETLKKANGEVGPRLDKTEEEIGLIKLDVSDINSSMQSVGKQQTEISSGIESLKKENVNRLQRELDAANRELRRRNRDDD